MADNAVTRTEILLKMGERKPLHCFSWGEIGGNIRQLWRMEGDGLISSQPGVRGKRLKERDWYLSHQQHTVLKFLETSRVGR